MQKKGLGKGESGKSRFGKEVFMKADWEKQVFGNANEGNGILRKAVATKAY